MLRSSWMFTLAAAFCIIATAIVPRHAFGQTSLAADAPLPPDEPTRIALRVHPADEPRPALKFTLTHRAIDQKPGNAALPYTRAMSLLQKDDQYNDDMMKLGMEWEKLPLDEVPIEDLTQRMKRYDEFLDTIVEASRYESADWQTDVREDGIMTLLPHLGEMRTAGRLLSGRIRVAIAEQRYDDAIMDIRAGYTLTRHVGEGDVLIEGLLGLSIANIMNDRLRELSTQPDAPNLFWPIVDMPSPFIEPRPTIRWDSDSLLVTIPELHNIREKELTAEQWNEALERLCSLVLTFEHHLHGPEGPTDEQVQKMFEKALAELPRAKSYLAEHGYDKDRIDAMHPAQAILIAMVDHFDVRRDNAYKWFNLPYWQSRDALIALDKELEDNDWGIEGTLSRTFISRLHHAPFSFAKTNRDLAMQRIVEAIRLYAARHDGALPPSLDTMTATPLPMDPTTGKPFIYRVEGGKAVLESPSPIEQRKRDHVIYEIEIVKK